MSRLLIVPEAAKILGISKYGVYYHIETGRLPYTKTFGVITLKEGDVEELKEYLRERRGHAE